MKIAEKGNELIIKETPGCLWLFGLFFAVIGAAFVYGSLGGYSNYEEAETWVLIVHFWGGSAAIATGFWLIFQAPVTKIIIDRDTKALIYSKRGLFGKQKNIYSFDQIKQFRSIEVIDNEGDTVWALGMELTSGETVKISSLPINIEKVKLNFALQANQFMYKLIPSFKDAEKFEDES